MPLYPFVCPACDAERDEIRPVASRDAPCPCTCGAPMERVPGTSSIAFATVNGNTCSFSGRAGVAKGNKRPITIGWGHGIGKGGKALPKLKKLPNGQVEVT